MRKDAGTYCDAQHLEQLGWMFFLKFFDDREKEMELLRWSQWATDDEGITGEALLDFVNNTVIKPSLADALRVIDEDANRCFFG